MATPTATTTTRGGVGVGIWSWWCDGYEGGCHSAAGATGADGAGAVAALTDAKRQVH